MKPALKSPSYLVRNHYSYCFRLTVPADLRKFVGRTELRYTLKTGYLRDAKMKARFISGQIQLIFRLLRKGGAVLAKLSDELVTGLVQQYIKNAIESWDRSFYEERGDDEVAGCRPYEVIDSFDDIREQLIDGLNRGDFSMLEQPIGELLRKNSIDDIDRDSSEYRKLCAEIHKAEIQLMPLHKKHMRCDLSYKKSLPEIFPELFPRQRGSQPATEEQGSETIQHVLDAFWKENSPNWKKRTVTEYRTSHSNMIAFLGHDRMIHTVDYQDGRAYKEALSGTKTKRGGPMSPARIDIYLGYAAQVFNWAIKQHYVNTNPFAGLQFGKKKQKRADQQREAFSADDLKKMFVESPYFGQDLWRKYTNPHYFWIPLIGLYTGARLEEIAQLYVEDVKLIDDVYCLDINENGPDKSIKTGEQRIIPMHDFLIKDLDFIGYVQSLPQDGRVFPELKRVNHRYSHGFSMWFSKFKKDSGVTGTKTFHSFRHLVTSHLLERDVPEYRIAQLIGHVTESQTTGRYGKKFKPGLLKSEVVDKIDYGIDLSHLKKSIFVPRKNS